MNSSSRATSLTGSNRNNLSDGVAAMDHELQIKCNELLKRIKHLQDSL